MANVSSKEAGLCPMYKVTTGGRVARNTIWMLLGQGSRLVVQALYFVLIARSLGAAGYGAFLGVVAMVAIVTPFGDLGSGGLLLQNVSRDKSLFPAYWGKALVKSAASSLVLFVSVVSLSHFTLPHEIPAGLVMLVCASDLLGLNLLQLSGLSFQAFDRLNWTATLFFLVSASRLGAAVILTRVHPHPSPLQWGYVYFGGTIVVAALAVFLVCVKLGRPSFNWRPGPDEVREGLYFSVGLSAQTIYNDLDKTMLARLGTLDATGIYGAAYRLIDISFVPVSSLLTASYSNFFRAGVDGISASLSYAKPFLLRALGYAILAFLVLLTCAGLLPRILGPEYARTVEALRWLSILPLIKVFHYFFSNALTGAGHQALRTVIQVGVAVFNVAINFWLLPVYSWRGAAWSSIASDGLLAVGIGLAALVLARRSERSPSVPLQVAVNTASD
jgi:O-antigen/teichoic acid export membrane protein